MNVTWQRVSKSRKRVWVVAVVVLEMGNEDRRRTSSDDGRYIYQTLENAIMI